MYRLKLLLHQRNFSEDDLLINGKDFPGVDIGDVIEIYDPAETFTRLLLQVTKLKDDFQQNAISIEAGLGAAFHLRAYRDVIATVISNRAEVELHLVEVTFRDFYLSRSDMWQLIKSLRGKCLHLNQKLDFLSARFLVYEMWAKGTKVACGVVGSDTKVVFRSCSANVILFLQLSDEFWQTDPRGDAYFEKCAWFLRDIFHRWHEEGMTHDVSVILFARVYYDGVRQSDLHDDVRECLLRDRLGRFYEDFYHVVIQNEKYDNWCTKLPLLKRLFHISRQRILGHHGVDAPVGRLASAMEGNVLEVLNIAIQSFENHHVERNFERTGQMCVVVSPGVGVFEVDRELLQMTRQKSLDFGIGNDLVFLGEQPFHVVPLCILHNRDGRLTDYAIPNWLNHSYYTSPFYADDDAADDAASGTPRLRLSLQDHLISAYEPGSAQHAGLPAIAERDSTAVISDPAAMDAYDEQVFQPSRRTRKSTMLRLANYGGSLRVDGSRSPMPSVTGRSAKTVRFASSNRRESLQSAAGNDNERTQRLISELHLDTGKSEARKPDYWLGESSKIPVRYLSIASLTTTSLTRSAHYQSLPNLDRVCCPPVDSSALSGVLPEHRPSRALINPFAPSRLPMKATPNRRRWVDMFPRDEQGKATQLHHQRVTGVGGGAPDVIRPSSSSGSICSDGTAVGAAPGRRPDPLFGLPSGRVHRNTISGVNDELLNLTEFANCSSSEDVDVTLTSHGMLSTSMVTSSMSRVQRALSGRQRVSSRGDHSRRISDLPEGFVNPFGTSSTGQRGNAAASAAQYSIGNSPPRTAFHSLRSNIRSRLSPTGASPSAGLAAKSGSTSDTMTLTGGVFPKAFWSSPAVASGNRARRAAFAWGITGEQEWTPDTITRVDWKSLTMPACLPVTTDHMPEQQELSEDYRVNEYDLLLETDSSGGHSSIAMLDDLRQSSQDAPSKRTAAATRYRRKQTLDQLYDELVSQRLQAGFQIVCKPWSTATGGDKAASGVGDTTMEAFELGRRATQSNDAAAAAAAGSSPLSISGVSFGIMPRNRNLSSSSKAYQSGAVDPNDSCFLSLGSIYHRLEKKRESNNVHVTIYSPNHQSQCPDYHYRYRFRIPDSDTYSISSVCFKHERMFTHPWNHVDMYVSSVGGSAADYPLEDAMKYWKGRFIILPCGNPSVKTLMETCAARTAEPLAANAPPADAAAAARRAPRCDIFRPKTLDELEVLLDGFIRLLEVMNRLRRPGGMRRVGTRSRYQPASNMSGSRTGSISATGVASGALLRASSVTSATSPAGGRHSPYQRDTANTCQIDGPLTRQQLSTTGGARALPRTSTVSAVMSSSGTADGLLNSGSASSSGAERPHTLRRDSTVPSHLAETGREEPTTPGEKSSTITAGRLSHNSPHEDILRAMLSASESLNLSAGGKNPDLPAENCFLSAEAVEWTMQNVVGYQFLEDALELFESLLERRFIWPAAEDWSIVAISGGGDGSRARDGARGFVYGFFFYCAAAKFGPDSTSTTSSVSASSTAGFDLAESISADGHSADAAGSANVSIDFNDAWIQVSILHPSKSKMIMINNLQQSSNSSTGRMSGAAAGTGTSASPPGDTIVNYGDLSKVDSAQGALSPTVRARSPRSPPPVSRPLPSSSTALASPTSPTPSQTRPSSAVTSPSSTPKRIEDLYTIHDCYRQHYALNEYRTALIDADPSNREERAQWASLRYMNCYQPSCAYELELRWLVASSLTLGELISSWSRKAISCGFHMLPIPEDPFSLPGNANGDALRGPIFVPLVLQPMDDVIVDSSNPEVNSTCSTLLSFAQEEIAKAFGFMHLQSNANCMTPSRSPSLAETLGEAGSSAATAASNRQSSPLFSTKSSAVGDALSAHVASAGCDSVPTGCRQYVHCTGGMFLMAIDDVCRPASTGEMLCWPWDKERSAQGLIASQSTTGNEAGNLGFLWAWNNLMTRRWRSSSTGDESFMDMLLADFQAFCSDEDGRLSEFFRDLRSL